MNQDRQTDRVKRIEKKPTRRTRVNVAVPKRVPRVWCMGSSMQVKDKESDALVFSFIFYFLFFIFYFLK